MVNVEKTLESFNNALKNTTYRVRVSGDIVILDDFQNDEYVTLVNTKYIDQLEAFKKIRFAINNLVNLLPVIVECNIDIYNTCINIPRNFNIGSEEYRLYMRESKDKYNVICYRISDDFVLFSHKASTISDLLVATVDSINIYFKNCLKTKVYVAYEDTNNNEEVDK